MKTITLPACEGSGKTITVSLAFALNCPDCAYNFGISLKPDRSVVVVPDHLPKKRRRLEENWRPDDYDE